MNWPVIGRQIQSISKTEPPITNAEIKMRLSHWPLEKTGRASYCLRGPENEASEIWPAPLLRDRSRCKSFCLALSKIFPGPLYDKMKRFLYDKMKRFCQQKSYTIIPTSYSWSLSNSHHNPLLASFSEQLLLNFIRVFLSIPEWWHYISEFWAGLSSSFYVMGSCLGCSIQSSLEVSGSSQWERRERPGPFIIKRKDRVLLRHFWINAEKV